MKVNDLKKTLRRQKLSSDADHSENQHIINSDDSDRSSSDKECLWSSGDENSVNGQNETPRIKAVNQRQRGRRANHLKQKKNQKLSGKDFPENIGLHVEDFFHSKDAALIIKQALGKLLQSL